HRAGAGGGIPRLDRAGAPGTPGPARALGRASCARQDGPSIAAVRVHNLRLPGENGQPLRLLRRGPDLAAHRVPPPADGRAAGGVLPSLAALSLVREKAYSAHGHGGPAAAGSSQAAEDAAGPLVGCGLAPRRGVV